MSIERDEELLKFATPRQAEILVAYWKHGTQKKTAAALGIAYQTVGGAILGVKRRAAKHGHSPDHDLTHQVPDGYKIKGVSTLYREGQEAPVLQWVKTNEDHERQMEILREMVAGLSGEIVPVKPLPGPDIKSDELLAVYPVGDHHLGMYAWKEESGGNYTMEIAERLLASAFSSLTTSLPKTGQALLVFLGDLFHYDSLEPVTPTAKNQLDSDGRYALMIRTGIRLVRNSIAAVMARHQTVHVIIQAGNHDPSSALFLAECLAALFENEPRISIDTSPRQFHYHEHGRNLVGVCHGHETKKLDALPLIMARDMPEAWGRTSHRFWMTGHVHQDRVVDVQGVRCESFRVLPPTDAWADGKGYRGTREMKALLLHQDHGEVQRVSVNPGMFAPKK